MGDKKVSVVIPAFNEEESIATTITDAKASLEKLGCWSEIIVVNDGSSDGTAKILNSSKNIRVIHHPVNKGYGASLKSGIRAAKGDWILIADADGTYPLESIPKLVDEVPKYDMVVAARTGDHVRIPAMRRPAKWILNRLANYLTGVRIPDLNSGLRIFRKDVVMESIRLFPERFSFTTTLTLLYHTNNYNVKYIPINYYERKGKSSIKGTDFVTFMNLIFRMVLYFRPLNVFLPISATFLAVGTGMALRNYIVLSHLATAEVVMILTGIQIGFLGLIADLIIKRGR